MDSILFLQSLDIPAADDGPLSVESCARVSSTSNACSTCSQICDVGGFGDFYF